MRSRGQFDLLFFAECGNGPAVHGGGGACVVSVVGTTSEIGWHPHVFAGGALGFVLCAAWLWAAFAFYSFKIPLLEIEAGHRELERQASETREK